MKVLLPALLRNNCRPTDQLTDIRSHLKFTLSIRVTFPGNRGGGGGGSGGGGDGHNGGEGWRLEDAIPGVPGEDYPTISIDNIPQTGFTCDGQVSFRSLYTYIYLYINLSIYDIHISIYLFLF